jgi:hypothetical protein
MDGPPKPPGHPGGHGGGHELQAVMDTLHKILQGLESAGIVPKGPDPKMIPGEGPAGGPPPPGPAAPSGPPKPPGPGGPAGGPPGAGGPGPGTGPAAPYGNKLKPGEIPNKPGMVPVGAPAFASTKEAGPGDPFSWSPNSQPANPGSPDVPGAQNPTGNGGVVMNPPCSKCGGPTQGGVCPTCTGHGAQVPNQQGTQIPGTPRAMAHTFHIASSVQMTPLQAHTELTAEFAPKGYKVTQLVPQDDGTYVAELTRQ